MSKMRLIHSTVALLLLVFAGCSVPRGAVLPPVDDDPSRVPEGYRVLRTGDYVRIETKSHDEVLGEVKEVTQDHVVVGRAGNYGYVEKSIQADDILIIELNGGRSAGDEARTVTAILLVPILLGVMMLAHYGMGLT